MAKLWSSLLHPYLLLGGGLNSRRLPKSHAITAGTKKNRISRHRQNSHHQQQITMGTAHSAHPMTSPNLNKTMRTLCRTQENSIQLSCHQQQITLLIIKVLFLRGRVLENIHSYPFLLCLPVKRSKHIEVDQNTKTRALMLSSLKPT